MAKNVFLVTIVVFLIVADVSDASFLWKIRKLIAPPPNEDRNGSPMPSPDVGRSQSSSVAGEKKGKEKEKQPTPPLTTGKDKPKPKVDQGTNDAGPAPATDTKKEDKKPPKEEVKEKDKSQPDLPREGKDSCSGLTLNCHDTKSMIACVKNTDHATSTALILIQNGGDSSIKVDLTIPPSVKKSIDVPKLQTNTVNVSLPKGGSHKITLNAGNGVCVLDPGVRASDENFFRHLPSYSKFMTPIYGAYFLFAIILLAGGVWACCWFGKRKAHSEIPYQELEMSVPESAAAPETAQGWDQDWDDDWDEEKAVTSPGAKNISANGLTSRTPNKDGWEDWDD